MEKKLGKENKEIIAKKQERNALRVERAGGKETTPRVEYKRLEEAFFSRASSWCELVARGEASGEAKFR